MPKFSYVALDTRGKEISGVLESENTTAAVSRIREMGYFPTNVAEADKAPAKKGGKSAPGGPAQGKAAGQEGDSARLTSISQLRESQDPNS